MCVFYYPLKASNHEGIRLPRNISKMYIFLLYKYYLYNYRSIMWLLGESCNAGKCKEKTCNYLKNVFFYILVYFLLANEYACICVYTCIFTYMYIFQSLLQSLSLIATCIYILPQLWNTQIRYISSSLPVYEYKLGQVNLGSHQPLSPYLKKFQLSWVFPEIHLMGE